MRLLRAALCATLLVTAGCGADAVGPAAVILLTNSWHEEGNPTHTFDLVDDTGGDPRDFGTFTGTETLNGVEHGVTGNWRGGWVEMVLARSPGVTWQARIRSSNTKRLEFSSTLGKLVIVHP